MSLPLTHPGRLHQIPRSVTNVFSSLPPLVVFEHLPHPSAFPNKNTLLFLPGLFDGLLTVPYTPTLAASLPEDWKLIEPILSSSYRQWGFSSLNEDVAEIAQLVTYFRNLPDTKDIRKGNNKVVLLGHSTGCQMIMHYLLSNPTGGYEEGKRPRIDGVIMQGSVSDREAMNVFISTKEYEDTCKTAKQYIDDESVEYVLPIHLTQKAFGNAPVTAKRFLSLASPGPDHVGEDDYFSSDLGEERLKMTFGKIGGLGVRVAFLFGERDQYVPDHVDKDKLVESWQEYVKKGGGVVDEVSGVLPGATHTLKEGGVAVEELTKRVNEYLKTV
ncbi:MAG: hypothetical protein Q9164_006011 [Protoblastenia rupestris]